MMPALKELKRYVFYLFRNLAGLWKKVDNDYSACRTTDTAVILVQGYTLSYYAIGGALKQKLEKLGFKVFVFVSGSTMKKSIEDTAAALGQFVEQVCQRCGVKKVCLVGHSMGGLIAKYYLQKLGGEERISLIITIGAPFFGTWTSSLAFYTKPGRQMIPGSDFLKETNKETGFLDRILSIRAQSDQFVKPKKSAYLPGARNIELALVGHTTLLESKEVLSIIGQELAKISLKSSKLG